MDLNRYALPALFREIDIDLEWKDLLKLPYARHVLAAYKWAHIQRIKGFLRNLNTAVDQLPEPDRAAFERHINSDDGARLLAEYAQSVIRSRSERVTAALAILYADAQHREYSSDFKAAAALALEGLAERTIDGFLLLVSHKQDLKHVMLDANHTLCLLASAKRQPALAEWSQGGNEWVGIVHDLIGRGIFLPNIARQIEQLDRSVWSCYFTINRETETYAALLNKAHTFLRGF